MHLNVEGLRIRRAALALALALALLALALLAGGVAELGQALLPRREHALRLRLRVRRLLVTGDRPLRHVLAHAGRADERVATGEKALPNLWRGSEVAESAARLRRADHSARARHREDASRQHGRHPEQKRAAASLVDLLLEKLAARASRGGLGKCVRQSVNFQLGNVAGRDGVREEDVPGSFLGSQPHPNKVVVVARCEDQATVVQLDLIGGEVAFRHY